MEFENKSNKKRIAKNTLLLYTKMLITMGVSLYTSRVVLHVLGVDDYGTYNVVGGVVGMLSFLNAALSNGTSRFITYSMGKGDIGLIKKVFHNSVLIHLLLAIIVLVIAETLGLWFVLNKAAIPIERLNAAVIAYHCSIAAGLVAIFQVPWTSLVISHEKMSFYAYLAILDAILKLLVVYCLLISDNWDKLIIYAILLLLTQFADILICVIYCKRNFAETKYGKIVFDKKLSKEILSFSSWSLIGNLTGVLNNQGMTIITNIFFGPAVVSARAISISVNVAVSGFVNNFRTAANPQIIKLYAAGEKIQSKELLLSTTKYSFFLMLLLAVPFICVTDEILHLWLVEVPDYTCIFVQLIMIQTTLFTFDTCFYTGLYACGKVRANALISPTYYFVQFVVVYYLFKAGFSPVSLSLAGIATSLLVITTAKPILLRKYAGYNLSEIYHLLLKCLVVSVMSVPFPLLAYIYLPNSVVGVITKIIICESAVIPIILMVGLNKHERRKVLKLISDRLRL